MVAMFFTRSIHNKKFLRQTDAHYLYIESYVVKYTKKILWEHNIVIFMYKTCKQILATKNKQKWAPVDIQGQ